MCLPYQNVPDAQQHLLETVVLYDDRPVYVRSIFDHGEGIFAELRYLPRMNNPITVSVFDEKFDAKALGSRLGYANLEDYGAYYFRRIPARQYKQGLTRQNVAVGDAALGRIGFGDAIRMAGFADMMMGVYPSYDAALKRLKDTDIRRLAFDRDFCLVKQDLGYFLLEYKGEKVAWGDPKEFKVPSQFHYLTQTMTRLGVPHVS